MMSGLVDEGEKYEISSRLRQQNSNVVLDFYRSRREETKRKGFKSFMMFSLAAMNRASSSLQRRPLNSRNYDLFEQEYPHFCRFIVLVQ